jgi:SAM-dependent MidA family methyltransferase
MPTPPLPHGLPAPDPHALAHSHRLVDHIRAEIAAAGGWISFARYMELALYAPGLGYYAAGAAKLGPAGDFVTAPELTPLFGRTLARTAAAVLEATGGDVLELGAGSGRLARDLLGELTRLERPPGRYFILEVSPDLRERQRATLAEAGLADRVEWLDTLPDSFTGLVLGNEVLDALPAHLLHWTAAGVMERGVVWASSPSRPSTAGFGGGETGSPNSRLRPPQAGEVPNYLAWADRPLPGGALAELAGNLPVTGDYLSEACPAAAALVASLGARLARGALLFLDYGFPRAEYYHPQRAMGTVRVHYRHHSLDDPFFLPGLADITAHVDFSLVARAGEAAGLELLGYLGQAQFLLDAGLLDLMLELEPMTPAYLREASAVQKLVQPSEMGELFKAMVLGRGLESGLPGFRKGDRRGAL